MEGIAMDPRQNPLPRIFMLILAGATLSACSTTAERATGSAEVETATVAPVDLSGEWTLNYPLSDDPSEVLGNGTSASESGFGLLKSIGYSIGVYGISVGDIADMLPRRERDEPVIPREITDAMDELSVVQDETTIEIVYDQVSTVVYRNGDLPRETDAYQSAIWEDGAFVVEREPAEGLPIGETFLLAPDGKQLIWIVKFELPNGDDLEITRIYDRRIEPPPSPANSTGFIAARGR